MGTDAQSEVINCPQYNGISFIKRSEVVSEDPEEDGDEKKKKKKKVVNTLSDSSGSSTNYGIIVTLVLFGMSIVFIVLIYIYHSMSGRFPPIGWGYSRFH